MYARTLALFTSILSPPPRKGTTGLSTSASTGAAARPKTAAADTADLRKSPRLAEGELSADMIVRLQGHHGVRIEGARVGGG